MECKKIESSSIQDATSSVKASANPALKRIQEKLNHIQDHPQMYSRMHHRHNRS